MTTIDSYMAFFDLSADTRESLGTFIGKAEAYGLILGWLDN